jgi:hypothetical protein
MVAARPAMESGGIQVSEVFQDGQVVASLIAIDHGDTITVVTEVLNCSVDGGDAVRRRPFTFEDPRSALAFVAEVLTSFTYLGCEVRQR